MGVANGEKRTAPPEGATRTIAKRAPGRALFRSTINDPFSSTTMGCFEHTTFGGFSRVFTASWYLGFSPSWARNGTQVKCDCVSVQVLGASAFATPTSGPGFQRGRFLHVIRSSVLSLFLAAATIVHQEHFKFLPIRRSDDDMDHLHVAFASGWSLVPGARAISLH